MVLKAHFLGIAFRLHDRVNGTTSFLFRQTRLFHAVIRAERNPHDLVALLQKKHGTDCRVYSSGHAEQNTWFGICNL